MLTKRIKFLGVFVLFIGLVVAMTGCDMGDGVVDEIEDEPLKITYIEEISDKNVGHGTDFENINLPEEIEVTLSDNSTTSFNVTWLEDDYNGEIAGTYTIVGELELTDDIINPDDLYPTLQINVQEEGTTLYSVSVEFDDEKGTVTGYGNYEEGEEVTLTATAKKMYEFVEWTGYKDSAEATITLDMPAENVELTAVFEESEKNSSTKTIDDKGGEISLDDGTTLKVPQGALEEETEITLQKENEDKYTLDDIYETVVYLIKANVEKFEEEVKLKYSLPENAPVNLESYLVGLIEEEIGGIVYEDKFDLEIKDDESKGFQLVITTNSFSISDDLYDETIGSQAIAPEMQNPLAIKFNNEPLASKVKPLQVPFYHQGDTGYCWAAVFQMLRAAYNPGNNPGDIWSIIGDTGIDKDRGLRFYEVGDWHSSKGIEVETDIFFRANSLEKKLKNQLSLGRPVAYLYYPWAAHAVVIVGYDDTQETTKFYYQDPKNPKAEPQKGSLSYIGKDWNLVRTLYMTGKMHSKRSLATINIMENNSMIFEDVNRSYINFTWDHTVDRGYSFEGKNIIPSNASFINLENIAIANITNDTKEVNLKTKIQAQSHEQKDVYENEATFTIKPHQWLELRNVDQIETRINVLDFQNMSQEMKAYDLILSLEKNGKVLNKKTISFTMDSYTKDTYLLNINKLGEGTVKPNEGNYLLKKGQRKSITAEPDNNWYFSHWEGDVPNEDNKNNILVTMDEDKTVTAHFVEADEPIEEYTLTIETKGSGSTDPAEGTHTFNKNEIVNILANPDEGWKFSHWEGDLNYTSSNKESAKTISRYDNLTSIENNTQVSKKSEVEFKSKDSSEKTIKMDNDKYLKAVFEKKEKEDTITTNISGEILGDGEYPVDHIEAIIFKEVNDNSWSGIKNTNINANGEFEFKDVKLEIESNYDVGFWQDKSRKSYYFHTYKDLNINSNTPVNYELGEIEMNTGSCLHLIVKDPNGNRMKNTRLDVSASSGGWSGFRTNSEGEIYFGLRESNDSDVKVSITDGENYYKYEEQTFEGITFNYREKVTLVVQF